MGALLRVSRRSRSKLESPLSPVLRLSSSNKTDDPLPMKTIFVLLLVVALIGLANTLSEQQTSTSKPMTSEAAAQRVRLAQAMDADSAAQWDAETEGVHHQTLKLTLHNPTSLGTGMTDEQVCVALLRGMSHALDTARLHGFLHIRLDLRPRVVTCRI